MDLTFGSVRWITNGCANAAHPSRVVYTTNQIHAYDNWHIILTTVSSRLVHHGGYTDICYTNFNNAFEYGSQEIIDYYEPLTVPNVTMAITAVCFCRIMYTTCISLTIELKSI